jgi:Xaa-Pro aminopeptidase
LRGFSIAQSIVKYAPLDPQLFVENRRQLAASLKPGSLAVIHSAAIPALCADGCLAFRQNSDLFYLSGADQEDTVLMLCPDAKDPAHREILFVRETSDLIAVWEGAKLSKERATEVSGIGNVQWTDEFDAILRRLARQVTTIYLNYNEHPRAGIALVTVDDQFRGRCQDLYPDHHYERLAPLLHAQRVVKSKTEVEVTRKACKITRDAFHRVLEFVEPGVLEYEVEAEYLHEFVRQGSKGFAYEPIVASGGNACVLHYIENDQLCEDGQLLLMDVGAEYANYNADMTRTIPVNGKFTDRQRAVYDAVHRVLRKCIDEWVRPGVVIKEYQMQVARMMEDELIGLGLIDADVVAEERRLCAAAEAEDASAQAKAAAPKEEDKAYRRYFMHGTSHSLGLDVHDVTPVDPEFVDGMLVTVEPGIYIREEEMAVRLENDIVVRAEGNIDLMGDIPINADEIEKLMAGSARRRLHID